MDTQTTVLGPFKVSQKQPKRSLQNILTTEFQILEEPVWLITSLGICVEPDLQI